MAAQPFRLPHEEDPLAGGDGEAARPAPDAAFAPAVALSGAGSAPSAGGTVPLSPAPPIPLERSRPHGRGTVPSPERELTPRALALGCAIGAVLAAGNVYTGLKIGFIDSGALTATLVSFATFGALRRFGPRTFTPLENNIVQTVAASAAVMSLVHGCAGAMPALALMGAAPPPAWALWTWGLALGVIGVLVGLWSRQKLVVEDALPFPSGGATAELIQVLHADRRAGVRPVRLLAVAAVAAGVTAWCRDGHGQWLPQTLYLPLAVGGLAASGLTLGVAVSPLMAATGIFIGLRGAATLAGAGMLAWGLLAPILVRSHVVAEAGYASLVGWLVWPAFGLLLGGSVGPMLVGARQGVQVVLRTLGDARNLLGHLRRPGPSPASDPGLAAGVRRGRRDQILVAAALAAAVALLVFTGERAFGLSVGTIIMATLVAIALAGVCGRAAGETDIAPTGNMGTLGQLLFAHGGPAGSILAGAVASGNATQTSQTLWALKAGHLLRAGVRSQALAQLVGVLLGSLVVVPTYLAILRTTPLGTEQMPAAGALTWRATAQAVSGGLSHLPAYGWQAAALTFVLGLGLSAAARTRVGRFLPSPVIIGIALIIPFSLSMTILIGAACVALVRRRLPSFTDADAHALGAGALAGESLIGVILAILSSL